ncbi:hypothetical protein FACS189468_2370 [Spirochaetia bacterium]|nr:hypothetical protein FACS189468_2370 [Spirochaetia bacterium]
MKKTILVIDGMGGGIGVQLIGRIRGIIDGSGNGGEIELIALGTNAVAAERMIKAGAHRGAAGENAVKVSASLGDFILGPIGIVLANSLMGEVTPAMAEAILAAPGERILLPLHHEHFNLVGVEPLPFAKMIDRAVEMLREKLGALTAAPGNGINR